MPKIYFPGINTLRFYAAMSVVLYHFVAPSYQFGDTSPFMNTPVRPLTLHGHDAVTLFFVISGFLIFTLLLREKTTTGTVSVRQFYLRRVFRILPLYYLTIGIGIVTVLILSPLLTERGWWEWTNPLTWVGLMLFFYNMIGGMALPITHLWSLNVEEQFYIVAPHLIKRLKSLPLALLWFAGLKLLLQLAWFVLHKVTGDGFYFYLFNLFSNVGFESIALGGLGAYLVFHRHPLVRTLTQPAVQIAAGLGFLIIALVGTNPDFWYQITISVIFFLVVINIAAAQRCFYRVESPLLRRLGDLSYSIYMVHSAVIWFVYASGVRGLLYYGLIVGITLIAAYGLHTYYEKPFLRLRDRLTQARSTLVKPTAVG